MCSVTYCCLPVRNEIHGEVIIGQQKPGRVELESDEANAVRAQTLIVERQVDSFSLKSQRITSYYADGRVSRPFNPVLNSGKLAVISHSEVRVSDRDSFYDAVSRLNCTAIDDWVINE